MILVRDIDIDMIMCDLHVLYTAYVFIVINRLRNMRRVDVYKMNVVMEPCLQQDVMAHFLCKIM